MFDQSLANYICAHVVLIISLLLAVGYLYVRYIYSYWQRCGIVALRPSFPFGNFGNAFMQKCTLGQLMQHFYDSTTEPFIGVYAGVRPMFIVRDLELVQRVLNKDFNYFHDRGFMSDESVDLLTNQLFMVRGERWKQLRVQMTPAFTSGKLKAMFSTLLDCTGPLQEYLDKFVDRNESVEMRDLAARFATNIIASTAFGIEINCIENLDEEFRKYGRMAFDLTIGNGIRQLMSFVAPGLMKSLKIRMFNREVADFMIRMVQENLRYREENNVSRKDFFQLLIQIRNGGGVGNDDDWTVRSTSDEKAKTLTINELAAQAFLFFVAGFETSSAVISFCLYELAKNPAVQAKVHDDIDRVLNEHDGQLTYESLMEMKYLDYCLDETLRKYPPLAGLNRECTRNYQVPGTKCIIEKGTPVMIPVWALHYDEKFYPEPHEFKPERFADASRMGFLNMPFLGFGEGPRACIGTRLGRIQSKVGLVAILRKFKFELGDELLKTEMTLSAKTFLTSPENGIHLRLVSR